MDGKIRLLQGIKFRDTLIITLKGENADLFKKLGDYHVVLVPAVIDEEAVVPVKIDEPSLKNTRIDQLLTSNAALKIEGVNDKKKHLFFNKKTPSQKGTGSTYNQNELLGKKTGS